MPWAARCSRRSPRSPEYYPTRVETELLLAHGGEIAAMAGSDRVLVEFGSGSCRKTSLLIEALTRVRAYVPIDIAGESLEEAAGWLKEQHKDLVIRAAHRRLYPRRGAAGDRAVGCEARLLLRLDHRQSQP